MNNLETQNNAHKNINAYRNDFRSLDQKINNHPLVYLDTAASSQAPMVVIDEISRYLKEDHANVHRGIHTLSHRATNIYENARNHISTFINSATTDEIVFTRGTTESINLVAQSFCRPNIKPGDKILITHLEHHSNIVPWQLLCDQTNAKLVIAPMNKKGEIEIEKLIDLLDEKVRILSIAHVSNALGSILPIDQIIKKAHQLNIPVLIDGAQAIPHTKIDVQKIDADFYVFSSHKMYGPTGIGVLYGKEALLEKMPPYQGGGDMILEVRFSGTTFNKLPFKFEAGTPNISGAAGFGKAVEYVCDIGLDKIQAHEEKLHSYLVNNLKKIEGISLIGTAAKKSCLQSFLIKDIHPHDVGSILDNEGVAIRTGHHCAMPVMDFYGISGTARASLGLYSNEDDIDRLIAAIRKTKKIFRI
mgnify:FL=1